MTAFVVGCAPPPLPEPVAPVPPPTPALPPAPTYPIAVGDLSVVAVGDVLMHTNVKHSARAADRRDVDGLSLNHDGYDALFEHVDDVLSAADVAFANLETPIAPAANTGTRSMVFNASPSLLPALMTAGVDVVSAANNHAYDQGRAGLSETLAQLREAGLPSVGTGETCAAARAPVWLEANDVRVALIGATLVFNEDLNAGDDEPCVFALDEALALEAAADARAAGADAVFLSVHWGREYRTAPEPDHVALAHRLVEGGFDVILGHHPHVIQPVETVETADGRHTVIAYSLGNFISNQRYDYVFGRSPLAKGNPRDGLLLSLRLHKEALAPGPDGAPRYRTTLTDATPVPLWTDNDAGRIVAPSPEIRVVVLDDAIDAAIVTSTLADAPADADGRLEMLRARRAVVQGILGADRLPNRLDAPTAQTAAP